MKKVWAIERHWAVDGDYMGYGTTLFANIIAARNFYNDTIRGIIEDDWRGAVDKNGNATDGYVIEKTDDSFTIFEDGYYCDNHDVVKLVQLDVA